MTTGATIHTTEGLHMTVTRRTKPPIIPKLDMEMQTVDSDAPVNSSPAAAAASIGICQGD